MTLAAWFDVEAESCLAQLEAALERTEFDLAEAHRATRCLAGAARLAGENAVWSAATIVSDGTRAGAAPAEAVRERLGDTLHDLRTLIRDRNLVDRGGLDAIRERWSSAAVDEPAHDDAVAEEAAFFDWAARELASFADTLDGGIERFVSDPDDREGLGVILHRQRSLLGAAKLGEVAVVGETLRAVEELTQLIVRLNVSVKKEWLDVFRCARDALRSAVTSLAQGGVPGPVPALSRLRTLRDELMDRFGAREEIAAAPGAESLAQVVSVVPDVAPAAPLLAHAVAAATTPSPAGPEPDDDWTRAMRLRAVIENAIGDDGAARAALATIYDLLRKARP